ncbi:MAG: hypothetical protein IKB13_08665 [Clostridia bacterium]|nr:hypothetical protein [Clostridia bacterium]
MKKKGIIAIVILLVIALGIGGVLAWFTAGDEIHKPIGSDEIPTFYGETAIPKAQRKQIIPQHPYLAEEGRNGMHGNSYNTGTYNYAGPIGYNPVVTSRSMNLFGGLCATLMFDSQGRIITVSGNMTGFKLSLLDADTLEVLAQTTLPQRASTKEFFKTFDFSLISSDTSGGAYCHLLAGDRPIIGNSDNVVQIYYIDDSDDTPEWGIEWEFDLMPYLEEGAYITDAIPDYDGNIWFITRPGDVGFIAKDTEEVHMMRLENEEIQNSLAVAEDGVYIVSDHAMYRFDIDENGDPIYTWRTEYDRGTEPKPGAINQGSGTTPTLLDVPCSDGTVRKLCGITDNADSRVNLVVYDRITGETIVNVPLFEEGYSVSENSLIAYGRSFIVENNYSETGAGFLVSDPQSHAGVTRIDMNADCTDAFVAWHSDEAAATVVPKLSVGSGLVYLYTRIQNEDIDENDVAWYFTAVDFETGKTVYRVFTGLGRNWNNSYGPITIGPNGNAYIGVFNGLVCVSDYVE